MLGGNMFVSIILDPGGEESAVHLAELLTFHGIERVQGACRESSTVNEKQLISLKREIDRVTDYYDVIRIYQYPVEDVLAISTLAKKKWRKLLIRPPQKG